MITKENTNVSLIDEYLSENFRDSQSADRKNAKIAAKSAATITLTTLQSKATGFDPLQDQEPQMLDSSSSKLVTKRPSSNNNKQERERKGGGGEGKELKCGLCSNCWNYRGKQTKGYTHCPKCKHQVMIHSPIRQPKKKGPLQQKIL
jgi:hypothetical protein